MLHSRVSEKYVCIYYCQCELCLPVNGDQGVAKTGRDMFKVEQNSVIGTPIGVLSQFFHHMDHLHN